MRAEIRADGKGVALVMGAHTFPLTHEDATVLWSALTLALDAVSHHRLTLAVAKMGLRGFAEKCVPGGVAKQLHELV